MVNRRGAQRMRVHITVSGEVQGVGFRPFIYRTSKACGLAGWVANTSLGVEIEWEGSKASIEAGLQALKTCHPPISTIKEIRIYEVPIQATGNRAPGRVDRESDQEFIIRESIRERENEKCGNHTNEFSNGSGIDISIMPDIGLCDDCRRELLSRGDRRFRHPFVSCTYCGPRFTIIERTPYDRERTSMHPFSLCDKCRREYDDPGDRRYHAQTIACHDCGPQLKFYALDLGARARLGLESHPAGPRPVDPIDAAVQVLASGGIVAVKGIGGYHLACNALDESAVRSLRARKQREDEPFAVMMNDINTVREYCHVSPEEEMLLTSWERPIVLLMPRDRMTGSGAGARAWAGAPAGAMAGTRAGAGAVPKTSLASCVAGRSRYLGVMLPYAPVHELLLAHEACPRVLVMTSANRHDEPMIYADSQAHNANAAGLPRNAASIANPCGPVFNEGLNALASGVLTHDRQILRRCDDSVVRVQSGRPVMVRRSRGYVPRPIPVHGTGSSRGSGQPPRPAPTVLGMGGQLKNSFCVVKGGVAIPGQYIGDLESLRAQREYEMFIDDFLGLFRVQPELIACDLHPGYYSTRYGFYLSKRWGVPVAGVQHHHAHIASCLAENGVEEDAIGVAFDGAGLGCDGQIWGGEFFLYSPRPGAQPAPFTRWAHLAYIPMPGGEKAIREPWRMAAAYATLALGEGILDIPLPFQDELQNGRWELLWKATTEGLKDGSTVLTSSAGRLFDAVSALLGLCKKITYEGQAAVELEAEAAESLANPMNPALAGNSVPAHETVEAGLYSYAILGPESNLPSGTNLPWTIDVSGMIREIVQNLLSGTCRSRIARGFHHTLATIGVDVCRRIRAITGCNRVALSGGGFQNELLLSDMLAQLESAGFMTYIHHLVPTNDQGIALGQAVLARMGGGNLDVYSISRSCCER